jgi:hypothetical protein
MVREPHHDKSFIKKSKNLKSLNQKYFLGFKMCHSMQWFLVAVNEVRAEASTNGAKFQFDSFGELVCELRQIVSPAVMRDSFVVGFLLIFVCFVFEFVRSLRLVAYFFPIKPRSRSEAKVRIRIEVNEYFVVKPNIIEFK